MTTKVPAQSETKQSEQRKWLEKIRAMELPRKVRIMNVCGGHERSISMAGLRGVLPKNIELIPGPGCPVCICPEEDVYDAIQLALTEDVTLVAFGDMLRVPVNVPKGQARSLEQARAAGADIRPIASPMEAGAITVPAVVNGHEFEIVVDPDMMDSLR